MSKLALYLRLSVEERSERFESESISSQRMFLQEFVKSQDDLKNLAMEEYADDGFSGTNTNRPAFQRLMEDVKTGKVKTIVVKDLSRFMRNYIEAGDYLENIFPFMGVRFISINDGYDSKNENGNGTELDIQFKNLLYDFYAKDASEKIKSVMTTLKHQGKFLAWSPPFGYIRDPQDKHKIIEDKEVSFIVKEAFKLALDGLSTRKIAKLFNEKGYITPSERKKQTTSMDYVYNMVLSDNHKKPIWMHGAVIKLLGNENYTGTYCFNMHKVKAVGSNDQKAVPNEDWGRVYNNHVPLVSISDFQKLREMMAKKAFKNIDYKKISEISYSLKGYVFCEDCNHRLAFSKSVRTYGTYRYLRCRTCKTKGLKTQNVNLDKLEEYCLNEVLKFVDLEEVEETQPEQEQEQVPKEVQIEKLLKEKDEAFLEYKRKNLSRDDFLKLKEEIDLQIKTISEIVEVEEQEEVQITNELTRELVERYIEKVIVSLDGTYRVELKK